MNTHRIVIPEAEEVIDRYFPVLDHGFVALKDYMGGDASIEESARVSYGGGTRRVSDTRTLLRYLFRNRHTSPFEMCLHGDTRIPTMNCVGATQKTYTLKELEAATHLGKKGAWVKLLKIRTVNPDGTISATKIKNVWKTGFQRCYKVTSSSPLSPSIVVTDTHPFLTPNGYFPLSQLQCGDMVMMNGRTQNLTTSKINEIICKRKEGKTLLQIAIEMGLAESTISNHTRGMPHVKRKGGYFRKEVGSHSDPRAIARRTISLDKCAVCGGVAKERHHLNENIQDNSPSNLLALCVVCHNAFHYGTTPHVVYPSTIKSIEDVGFHDVYDLEVASDNHNFVAEHFVVHNCEMRFHMGLPIFVMRQLVRHRTAQMNEYSGRYSIMPMLFYTPQREHVCFQSKKNKQGRAESLDEYQYGTFWRKLQTARGAVAANYAEWVNEVDIAREVARLDLPLSTYTYCYWKCDLRNLFNVMSLRSDSHAQWEIQQFSDVICGLVKRLCPISFEAFQDYQQTSVTFTQLEMAAIRRLSSFHVSPIIWENPPTIVTNEIHSYLTGQGATKREVAEFWEKLRAPMRRDYSLDISSSFDSDHFQQMVEKAAIEVPISS